MAASNISLVIRESSAPRPPPALCPSRALRAAQRSQARRSLPQPLASRERRPTKCPSPLPPQTTRDRCECYEWYHTLLHNRRAARERYQSAADYVRRTPSPNCNLLPWRNQGRVA
ncbi:hypothetical protein MTO96_023015 [Rhipicephalus appendiculatus]